MQRHENESFADYKARRAAANLAVKLINHAAKECGSLTGREQQRRQRDNSMHAGAYGRNLRAMFASKLATPARLAIHAEYLRKQAARKAARSTAGTMLLAA